MDQEPKNQSNESNAIETGEEDLNLPQSSELSTQSQTSLGKPKRSHHKKKSGPSFTQPEGAPASSKRSEIIAEAGNQSSEKKLSPGSTKDSTSQKIIGAGRGKPDAKDKKALTAAIASGVQVATAFGSNRIVKDQTEREFGLFVASPEEAEKIAKPAVSIIERHGVGAGAGDSDAADIIQIIFEIALFVKSNLELKGQIAQRKLELLQNSNQSAQQNEQENARVTSSPQENPANNGGQENAPSVGAQVLKNTFQLENF